MNVFKEIPPTAGFPFYAKDFLSLYKKQSYGNSLEDDFKRYLGGSYVKITSSGTAGLYIILEGLKEISCKKTVIIPAYTCPSVALAILRAGLKIEACDINSHNFNFNYQDLRAICQKNNDILAIIPAYLGGMPLEFDILKKIAGEHEIFIIEDCAQALGATYKGMKVGTLGDFAFFSLARGKGLTIYEGGAIAINNKEYFSIFNKKLEELVKSDFFSESLKFLELLGYFVFYRPCLFWFVYRLPEIFWNLQGRHLKAISEYFSLDFPVHKVSKIRRFIGHLGFRRLEEEIDKQREKAFLYMEGLREIKGVNVIKESPDSRATYPFLTLIFDDHDRRQKILKILGNSGLGVSELYTLPISDYAYLSQEFSNKHLLGAHYLAKRQLILSTSIFLGKKDIGRILDILSSSLRG